MRAIVLPLALFLAGGASADQDRVGAVCMEAGAEMQSFLTSRYGAESPEAVIFSGGDRAERWGVAVSLYISWADQMLLSATEGSRGSDGPYELAGEATDDLRETAGLVLLAGQAAECLREPGAEMLIGDTDMGARFDVTHGAERRAAIRAFAEGLM